jgi:hypothetical protein
MKNKNIKNHVDQYVLLQGVAAQALKAYGEVGVYFQPFLSSGLVGNNYVLHGYIKRKTEQ